jgi:ABC-2 type transport system permease protein
MRMLFGQIAIETKLFIRRKDDLFWTLAFPMFFMVLYGIIYRNEMWADYGMRAIDFLLPGVLVMALMVTGIMATASGFAEERGKGIYRRLSLTPLKRSTLIIGQIIHRYLVILAQVILLLLVGILAFKIKIAGNYLLFWLILTFGALCLIRIGFSLTGLIRSARSTTPISMSVFFLLLFLGGIFIPINILPDFLQYVTNVLPTTHLSDALRSVIINGSGISEIWKNLVIVGGWTIGCLALAIKFFKWE